MKKNQKRIIAGLLVLVVIVSSVAYFVSQPKDACTSKDREQGNCVPAGRCTPPGDPRESTIDCQIKNYDRKFNLGE